MKLNDMSLKEAKMNYKIGAFILLLGLMLSGCTNQCIDADDFGFAQVTVSSRYPSNSPKTTYISDYQDKQMGAWIDSGYGLNGQPLTIVVKNWKFNKSAPNNSSSSLSAWSPWLGTTKYYSTLPASILNLRACTFGGTNGSTCTPLGTADSARILNAPCLMTKGIGLYGLITTPSAPDPNSSVSLQAMPMGYSFHVGAIENEAKLYDQGTLAGGIVVSKFNDETISNYADGRLYLKIMDTDYSDNAGQYIAIIKSGIKNGGINPFNTIAKYFKQVLFTGTDSTSGIVPAIYKNIILQSGFIKAVKAMLALYIFLMGAGFLIGIVQFTQWEMLVRVIKISIVSIVISPNSWNFFYTYLFNFFINGTEQIISMVELAATGGYGGGGENIISLLFAEQTWAKLSSLIFFAHHGILYVLLFIVLVFFIVYLYLKAWMVYISAFMLVGVVVSMAPIFICFMLFNFTKSVYDKWLTTLIAYSMQPIILFASLAFLGSMIRDEVYHTLGFKVCLTPIINLPIQGFSSSTKNFTLLSAYYPESIDTSGGTISMAIPKPVTKYNDDGSIQASYGAYEFQDLRYPQLPFLDPIADSDRINDFQTGKFINFTAIIYIMIISVVLFYFNDAAVAIAQAIFGGGLNLSQSVAAAGAAAIRDAGFTAAYSAAQKAFSGSSEVLDQMMRKGIEGMKNLGNKAKNAKDKLKDRVSDEGRMKATMDSKAKAQGSLEEAQQKLAKLSDQGGPKGLVEKFAQSKAKMDKSLAKFNLNNAKAMEDKLLNKLSKPIDPNKKDTSILGKLANLRAKTPPSAKDIENANKILAADPNNKSDNPIFAKLNAANENLNKLKAQDDKLKESLAIHKDALKKVLDREQNVKKLDKDYTRIGYFGNKIKNIEDRDLDALNKLKKGLDKDDKSLKEYRNKYMTDEDRKAVNEKYAAGLADLNKKKDAAYKDLESTKNKLSELELKGKKGELSSDEAAKYLSLRRELEGKQASLDKASLDFNNYKKQWYQERTAMMTREQRLAVDNQKLETDMAKLGAKRDSLGGDLKDLRSKAADLKAREDSLTDKEKLDLKNLEQNITNRSRELEKVNLDIANSKKEYDKNIAAHSKMQAGGTGFDIRNTELNKQKDDIQKVTDAKIVEKQKAIDDTKASLGDLTTKHDALVKKSVKEELTKDEKKDMERLASEITNRKDLARQTDLLDKKDKDGLTKEEKAELKTINSRINKHDSDVKWKEHELQEYKKFAQSEIGRIDKQLAQSDALKHKILDPVQDKLKTNEQLKISAQSAHEAKHAENKAILSRDAYLLQPGVAKQTAAINKRYIDELQGNTRLNITLGRMIDKDIAFQSFVRNPSTGLLNKAGSLAQSDREVKAAQSEVIKLGKAYEAEQNRQAKLKSLESVRDKSELASQQKVLEKATSRDADLGKALLDKWDQKPELVETYKAASLEKEFKETKKDVVKDTKAIVKSELALDTSKRSLADAQERLAIAKDTNSSISSNISNVERRNEQLNKDIENIKGRAEQSKQGFNDQKTELEKQRANANAELARLTTERDKPGNSKDALLLESISATRKNINDLGNQIKKIDQATKQVDNTVAREVKAINASIAKGNDYLAEARGEEARSKKALDVATRKFEDAKAKVDQNTSALAGKQQSYDNLISKASNENVDRLQGVAAQTRDSTLRQAYADERRIQSIKSAASEFASNPLKATGQAALQLAKNPLEAARSVRDFIAPDAARDMAKAVAQEARNQDKLYAAERKLESINKDTFANRALDAFGIREGLREKAAEQVARRAVKANEATQKIERIATRVDVADVRSARDESNLIASRQSKQSLADVGAALAKTETMRNKLEEGLKNIDPSKDTKQLEKLVANYDRAVIKETSVLQKAGQVTGLSSSTVTQDAYSSMRDKIGAGLKSVEARKAENAEKIKSLEDQGSKLQKDLQEKQAELEQRKYAAIEGTVTRSQVKDTRRDVRKLEQEVQENKRASLELQQTNSALVKEEQSLKNARDAFIKVIDPKLDGALEKAQSSVVNITSSKESSVTASKPDIRKDKPTKYKPQLETIPEEEEVIEEEAIEEDKE